MTVSSRHVLLSIFMLMLLPKLSGIRDFQKYPSGNVLFIQPMTMAKLTERLWILQLSLTLKTILQFRFLLIILTSAFLLVGNPTTAHYHSTPTLRTPPLSVISTLDLQIITSDWRLQPSIRDKLGPINIESAANSLSMRSWDRKVCRLLMQQEDIAMRWRSTSRWCRTKVR